MLPLGLIEFGRKTRFTPDEQRTMMTLWSIARSPLILGSDLTRLDDSTLALITNDDVLTVNQHSSNNRQLFRTPEGLIAWTADIPGKPGKYLAVFNTTEAQAAVPVKLADLGISGSSLRVRDLWTRKDSLATGATFAPEVPAHGAALYLLGAQ
jgi:hypothetical protein